MEFFSREGVGTPAKAIPPDKKAGPWLPRKNKPTRRGNVGKSPCGGTNDDNQRQTMSMEAAFQNEVTIKLADMEQRLNI